jgi:type IV pilus assembly protein PilA
MKKTHYAPTHQLAFSLLELMLILAIIGFLVLIGLPSYRSYIVRSQVLEGLTLAAPIKQKIVEYYMLQGHLPQQNLSQFQVKPQSHSIESLQVKSGGAIVITFASIDQLSKPTIILVPTDHQGMIDWDCTGGTLPREYRPQRCQK